MQEMLVRSLRFRLWRGVWQAATDFRVERSSHSVPDNPIQNEEAWSVIATNCEHMELYLTYERGIADSVSSKTKFHSAANSGAYQIWKIGQGLDIVRAL